MIRSHHQPYGTLTPARYYTYPKALRISALIKHEKCYKFGWPDGWLRWRGPLPTWHLDALK